jgi:hypothetical protein
MADTPSPSKSAASVLEPTRRQTPELSPFQAQLELALPPNRGLPEITVRIGVEDLRRAGYAIPEISGVSNVLRGAGGGVYTLPGGGYEMQFPYAIPPEFILVVR